MLAGIGLGGGLAELVELESGRMDIWKNEEWGLVSACMNVEETADAGVESGRSGNRN